MGINYENLIAFFSNQLNLLKKSNTRRAIVLIVLVLLIGFIGEYKSYYIVKNGIHVVAIIESVGHAPRGGYVAYIKYSYRYRPYQDAVSFTEDVLNKDNVGDRLIFAILPNHPTWKAFVKYAPDCLGDNPPEGWSEIPECE